MTKALVTGATGFLGQHTVRRLVKLGWEVYGQGRNPELGRRLEKEGAVFLPGDLRNAETADRACQGMDFVFHCAALSSPWGNTGTSMHAMWKRQAILPRDASGRV